MLSKSVRLAAGQRVRLLSGLSPFVSLLVGHCVRLVSLLFPFVSLLVFLLVAQCQLPCNPFHLSASSGLLCCSPLHVSQLRTAVSATCLQSLTFVSQLWAAVSASALQSFTCALSLATLHICLPALVCSALQSFAFVSQLWTAVSASALQSFVSQLWTSQALVAECSEFEKHKLFGVYGGVILFSGAGLLR